MLLLLQQQVQGVLKGLWQQGCYRCCCCRCTAAAAAAEAAV
jgi:hypothetical protein